MARGQGEVCPQGAARVMRCQGFSACEVCNVADPSLIPGSGRSPGEGHGNPLLYSCLRNPVGRGAWRAAVHGVPVTHGFVTKPHETTTCSQSRVGHQRNRGAREALNSRAEGTACWLLWELGRGEGAVEGERRGRKSLACFLQGQTLPAQRDVLFQLLLRAELQGAVLNIQEAPGSASAKNKYHSISFKQSQVTVSS